MATAAKTIRRPSTTSARNQAPEWTPRDIASMSEADRDWCDLVASKLSEFQVVAQAENAQARDRRWLLRDGLGDLLWAIASNTSQLIAERSWPLAAAAERAASTWLRSVEQLDSPAFDADLASPFYSLAEAWAKFCDPPQLIQTRTLRLESLAELDKLHGLSDSAACQIFATGDKTSDEDKWGPWISDGGILPSPNYERLRAARAGEAQVPSVRTITSRLPGWPTKQPTLLLLGQVAALDN